MNNFTEDLTGLSRADLVYKAKLAEQAERCAFRSPACSYHFRQKLQKSIPRRGDLCWGAIGARVGVPGAAGPVPRPSDALLREEDTADDSHPSFLGDLANRVAHRGARSGPDLARGIVFRPLSGSLGVPRWSSGRPWRAHAGATPRAGGAEAVIRPRIPSSGCSQRRSRASGRDRATSRARSRARPAARPPRLPRRTWRYPAVLAKSLDVRS